MSKEYRAVIGAFGCMLTTIGLFGPIIHVPLIGGLSLVSGPDGKLMLILTLAGLVAIWRRRYAVLWATGGLTAVMASAAWRTMMRALSEARQTAQDAAADGGELAKALVDMWAAGLSIGWAWAPLAVGCVCVLLAALGPRVRA